MVGVVRGVPVCRTGGFSNFVFGSAELADPKTGRRKDGWSFTVSQAGVIPQTFDIPQTFALAPKTGLAGLQGPWDGKPLILQHENRGQAFASVYENAVFAYTQPGLVFVFGGV